MLVKEKSKDDFKLAGFLSLSKSKDRIYWEKRLVGAKTSTSAVEILTARCLSHKPVEKPWSH